VVAALAGALGASVMSLDDGGGGGAGGAEGAPRRLVSEAGGVAVEGGEAQVLEGGGRKVGRTRARAG
jgi:hypothetical protein